MLADNEVVEQASTVPMNAPLDTLPPEAGDIPPLLVPPPSPPPPPFPSAYVLSQSCVQHVCYAMQLCTVSPIFMPSITVRKHLLNLICY